MDLIDMLDVLLDLFQEKYYVVDVKKASYPFKTREDDAQSALESFWGVGDAERHVSILKLTCVAYKGRFDAVLFQ